MKDFIRVEARNVEEAVEEAKSQLNCSLEELEYNVLDEGNKGFLGIGSRVAVIEARKLETESEKKPVEKSTEKSEEDKTSVDLVKIATDFLSSVFNSMGIEVLLDATFNEEEKSIEINMSGENMGNIIGKRGQTLDSIQYLTSLVVNKAHDGYIRVKLDTENYRERRKETLENLASNIAYKVKRTKRPVKLEPMNPYERRIIHSALQGDKYVCTKSEGEEPFRHVVVMLKRERRYSDSQSKEN